MHRLSMQALEQDPREETMGDFGVKARCGGVAVSTDGPRAGLYLRHLDQLSF